MEGTGDSQTLNLAGTITGSAQKVTAEPTSAPTAEPLPSTVANPASPVEPETPLPTAVPTPVPTAKAIPEPTPTPTEVPVDLSTMAWLTAQQAGEFALLEVEGELFEIAGHASPAAGVLGSGYSAGAELSPGIGYARDWSVTIQNDTEAIFCTIGLGISKCNPGGFHYGDGEIETVSVDSPEAIAHFNSENNSDWEALAVNEDISILLDLHVDLTGAVNDEPGTPIARIWSA